MNDNRLLCTSVARSFQVLWFAVQFSYFEIEKFLGHSISEQAAMEATSMEDYIKCTHCRYEIAQVYE